MGALRVDGVVVEPRKKTCGIRPNCGRCANCVNREWSRIWGLLREEDREWVREQVAFLIIYGGDVPPSRGSFGWTMLGGPSLTEYVLR